MRRIESEIDRCRALLAGKIRDQGFTQLTVQEKLGWGRSYISQIVTKQKALRLDQLLKILDVIGFEPQAFFAELYDTPEHRSLTSHAEELAELQELVETLTTLLIKRDLITRARLSRAIQTTRR